MNHLKRRVEERSLNAWPALEQILFDGWLLRFSDGYTKRANSVNPIYPSKLDLAAKIARCERVYSERGLDPIFRLNSWSSPEGLDEHLEQRSYRRIDPTWVMYRAFDVLPPEEGPPDLQLEPLEHWIQIFGRFTSMPAERNAIHASILNAIPSDLFLATLHDGGRPVACGLGVLEGGSLGLFDLITAPEERRKGYGGRLLTGLLALARSNGAKEAYLQVTEANVIARNLYLRHGFENLYNYWYRMK